MAAPVGSQLAERSAAAKAQTGEQRTMRDLVLDHKAELQRALGDPVVTDHFIRGALTALTATPKLQECTEESFAAAILLCAQLKLEIGAGLNQFHLTPRSVKSKKKVEKNGQWIEAEVWENVVVPIIGYQGYIALGYRHPDVLDFQKVRQRAGDKFVYGYTTERGVTIDWQPILPINLDAELMGVVIRSATRGGGRIETYLTIEEIERRRPASTKMQTRDGRSWMPNTPWSANKGSYEAMADKTVMREHGKWIPKSIEMEVALALDSRVLKRSADGSLTNALSYEEDFGDEAAALEAGAAAASAAAEAPQAESVPVPAQPEQR